MLPEAFQNPEALARFVREARAARTTATRRPRLENLVG
jgi:hypothetical protein